MARLRAVVVIQAPGLSGMPRVRPRLERADEGLLDGLLGEVEVAEDADERRDRPPRLLAEQRGRRRRGRRPAGQGDSTAWPRVSSPRRASAGASTPMFG